MSNKKAALLAGIIAASMAENQDPTIMKFGNPYEGLPDLVYSGNKTTHHRKTPMNNKQLKRRAAGKAARKARRKNR